ncbi:hypothetical protein KAT92_00040 [Candidatus Babeliales bacterium]|nr:hypothetical protein [Candidatus Babeliales bacterium]
MKKFVTLCCAITILLNSFTGQTTLSAKGQYIGAKITGGIAATAGSLVLWRHFDKEVKKLEKIQSLFAKMRGIDKTTSQRIKKLTLYKYFSLFVVILSCGYTIKQAGLWIKDVAEKMKDERNSNEEEDDPSDWKLDDVSFKFSYDNDTPACFFCKRIGKIFVYGIHANTESPDYIRCFIPLENSKQAKEIKTLWLNTMAKLSSKSNEISIKNVWDVFQADFEQQLKKSTEIEE